MPEGKYVVKIGTAEEPFPFFEVFLKYPAIIGEVARIYNAQIRHEISPKFIEARAANRVSRDGLIKVSGDFEGQTSKSTLLRGEPWENLTRPARRLAFFSILPNLLKIKFNLTLEDLIHPNDRALYKEVCMQSLPQITEREKETLENSETYLISSEDAPSF